MAQEQRFELISTLGKGGMAEVFLGWMNSIGGLRRKVAIKRILPELIQKQSKRFQQMFVDEARLAFQLEHDNVVRVYDVGQSANTFFIVMEYIEGFDLKTILEKLRESGTIFPLSVALYITLQVCSGLGYAHSLTDAEGRPLGLIHNDISPPNILIGRHGEVKVADFGLSDARSNAVSTPDGMIKGKFAYISPECTHNPPQVSSKSDIFSIGICLWEMLAGRKLFQRDTDLETFKAVRACVIPDIREFRNDIPEELTKILAKALEKDPAKRYQTCEDLYLDIASLATALQIPLNRYDLSWLINNIADNHWGFVGEKVSEAMQKSLQDELAGMLPPGDAEMLAELVTGMSEVVELNDLKRAAAGENANWIADVFNDVGFEEGAVVFKDSKNKPKSDTKSQPSGDISPERKSENSSKPLPAPKITLATPNVTPAPTRELSGMLPSSKSALISSSGLHKQTPNPLMRVLVSAALIMLGLIIGALITLLFAISQV